MNDPYVMTFLVGGGLLACGYLLGRSSGRKLGFDEVMAELFRSKLVQPIDVLTYYANMGNQRAKDALARLNAEMRKTKLETNKDDAED